MKGSIVALAAAASTVSAQGAAYSQCGGQGWSGATTCVSGYTCTYSNPYYSQCVPGSGSGSGSGPSSSAKPSTTAAPSKTTTPVSSPTTVGGSTTTTPASSSGHVQYAGVNIAGFDFGCDTSGTCTNKIVNPVSVGTTQMNHFVKDDGLNAFRLPVGWQYIVDSVGGTLNSNFQNYDQLVQACINSGAAMCIVDIHNYARYNGAIVGQGGPTNAQFASLWSQIATKYKSNTKVAFGVMNEPHDVDINAWATTVQAAVTAIRQAGATGNKILLPGNDYTSAGAFISNGSGAALIKVTNLDGSTTNLIFDVHKYLDSDNSGTHTSCTTNNVAVFQTLGDWLRTNKRQAILSETGGGPSDSSCLQDVCQELAELNLYSDVYLGWTGWAAGAFDSTYTLTETPNGNQDVPLVKQCIAGQFRKQN